MNRTYSYVRPTELGYQKFKLTRRQHNSILVNRHRNFLTKIEAYYRDDSIRLQYTTTFLGKVLITMMLPITVLLHGFSSIKEIAEEYRDLLNETKSGTFVSEHVSRTNYNGETSERFTKLEHIYKARGGR